MTDHFPKHSQENVDQNTKEGTSIGIVGGGWFGKAFAKNAVVNDHNNIILTTRTSEKLAQFDDIGVKGALFSLPITDTELDSLPATVSPLFDQQVLIIAIPPGFKKGRTDYASNIAEIVALAEKGKVQQLILLNSTAIYNGIAGEVNEQSVLQTSANKVALLAQAETELFKFSGKACSLRLAGLIGEDRHPGTFISRAASQNRKLPEPNAYINLIHQTDVIGLVNALINKKAEGVYNGVSATHITKKEYYTVAAQCLGLEAPDFSENTAQKSIEKNESKIVTDAQSRKTLQYQYKYDDLIAWLNEK